MCAGPDAADAVLFVVAAASDDDDGGGLVIWLVVYNGKQYSSYG